MGVLVTQTSNELAESQCFVAPFRQPREWNSCKRSPATPREHMTISSYVPRVAGKRIHTTCAAHPDFCIPGMMPRRALRGSGVHVWRCCTWWGTVGNVWLAKMCNSVRTPRPLRLKLCFLLHPRPNEPGVLLPPLVFVACVLVTPFFRVGRRSWQLPPTLQSTFGLIQKRQTWYSVSHSSSHLSSPNVCTSFASDSERNRHEDLHDCGRANVERGVHRAKMFPLFRCTPTARVLLCQLCMNSPESLLRCPCHGRVQTHSSNHRSNTCRISSVQICTHFC